MWFYALLKCRSGCSRRTAPRKGGLEHRVPARPVASVCAPRSPAAPRQRVVDGPDCTALNPVSGLPSTRNESGTSVAPGRFQANLTGIPSEHSIETQHASQTSVRRRQQLPRVRRLPRNLPVPLDRRQNALSDYGVPRIVRLCAISGFRVGSCPNLGNIDCERSDIPDLHEVAASAQAR